MKTTVLRLCGKRDLHLETFDLPEIQEDEVLTTVVTGSLCLSFWKEVNLGESHRKVPDDVATNPATIGHEFCDGILAVGKGWQHKFQPGQCYVIQASLQLPDRPDCSGYSFPWTGGEATHVAIPNEVAKQDCLLTYDGETYFEGSLARPLSYVAGVFNVNYHSQGSSYDHTIGIHPQGRTLILGDTGPMGLLAIDYALHGPVNPSLLVIIDINNGKLSYAHKHYPSELQTLIHYLNIADVAFDTLMALSGGHSFDDIFAFIPNEELVILASSLLPTDGCLNFFIRPQDKHFNVSINFYDVHYALTHYVGTSGGSTDDMRAAVKLTGEKEVQAVKAVTRILKLNAADETMLELSAIGDGKKLAYTGKYLLLTSLTQIRDQVLAAILVRHQEVWSGEAEQYLLVHAEAISHDQSCYSTLHVAGWSSRQLRDLVCG